jgi:SagB-type dehydrogenase family enzyme
MNAGIHRNRYAALLAAGLLPWGCAMAQDAEAPVASPEPPAIRLPAPRMDGNVSLEQSMVRRRSVREFAADRPLTPDQVSQLLWAAQGAADRPGRRTSPSAGGKYPLETYFIAGNVRDLPAGIYRYRPADHALDLVLAGDRRAEVAAVALDQPFLRVAAGMVLFSAVYERTAERYGDRAPRYVHMEAGHASQNILLQAAALGLGVVPVGAFDDDRLKALLRLPGPEHPLYLMPVGWPAGAAPP